MPLFVPLYGYVFWSLIIGISQTSITVYEDGLEWQRGGAKLFVRWEDLYELGRKPAGGSVSFGIYLNHSIEPEVNGFAEKLIFGRATNFITLTGIVDVPSYWAGFGKGQMLDTYKFADTEFGRELMRYAPHLFRDNTDIKGKNDTDDSSQNDLIWYEDEIQQESEGNP
jgi:hypothetical protein